MSYPLGYVDSVQEAVTNIEKGLLDFMLSQLEDLVKIGALTWTPGKTVLLKDSISGGYRIEPAGRFELREQDAFDRMKKRAEAAETKLAEIYKAFSI